MPVFNNILAGASGATGAAAGYQIDRSLRFNSGDSADLSKTFSSAGNRKTWTWSCWYKRSVLGTKNQRLFSCLTGSNDNTYLELRSFDDDTICLSGYATNFRVTDAEIRDPSAWYHLVVACDTTQSSNSDRVKLYLNGVQQTFRTEATITQDADLGFNQAAAHEIGDAFDGYLAEIHFVDGTQLAASDFGKYDDNNVWQPKEYSGTYGTNGFYLKFADNSSNAALGTDSSGNSNTWTVNNIDHVASTSIGLPSGYTANASTYSGTLSSIETDDSSGITAASSHIDFDLGASYTVGTVTAKFVNGQGSASANYRIELHGNSSYTNLLANSATLNSSPGSVQTITHDFGSTSAQYLRFSYQGGGRIGTLRFLSTTGATSVSGNPDGDSLIDTPTNYTADSGNNGGNYCTFNPISGDLSGGGVTMSNGNLEISRSGGSNRFYDSTMTFSSGKWYWEMTAGSTVSFYPRVGIWNRGGTENLSNYPGQAAAGYNRGWGAVGMAYGASGDISSGLPSFTANDTLMFAMDLDNGKIWFGKNGTWYSTGSTTVTAAAIAANTATARFTDLLTESTGTSWTPIVHMNSGDSWIFNPGSRPFSYTPPTGFLSLCTTNLPDPTIADGSTGFDTKLWQGTGVAKSITGYNFSPDLVWGKARSATNTHWLMDTVRGAGKRLVSADTRAEDTPSGVLTSFNSDGFSIGTNTESNNSDGTTYVGWAWDAGSSTASNSDGSITTNVRANASAGFSIIGYTGNATVGATLGHGLNSAPEWLVFKNRDDVLNWYVYHKAAGHTKYFTLDRTHGATTHGFLNNTAPTNSVITLNNTAEVNATGQDIICYAWTSVSGYSSFGSYLGNGSSDGPFVFTGMRPALVICKASSTSSSWNMFDSTRASYNVVQAGLLADEANAEFTGTDRIDILSNGFKVRSGTAEPNASGVTYVYMAWAEHPFATARAR